MPIGKTQGWKALQNDTPNYVILIEPPDADPHVRWCERGRLAAAPYSIKFVPLPLWAINFVFAQAARSPPPVPKRKQR